VSERLVASTTAIRLLSAVKAAVFGQVVFVLERSLTYVARERTQTCRHSTHQNDNISGLTHHLSTAMTHQRRLKRMQSLSSFRLFYFPSCPPFLPPPILFPVPSPLSRLSPPFLFLFPVTSPVPSLPSAFVSVSGTGRERERESAMTRSGWNAIVKRSYVHSVA